MFLGGYGKNLEVREGDRWAEWRRNIKQDEGGIRGWGVEEKYRGGGWGGGIKVERNIFRYGQGEGQNQDKNEGGVFRGRNGQKLIFWGVEEYSLRIWGNKGVGQRRNKGVG